MPELHVGAHIVRFDDEDAHLVLGRAWRLENHGHTWYLATGKHTRLHQLILPTAVLIDHINLDGLDNRRANLREATQSQNMMNGSIRSDNVTGVKGVYASGDRFRGQVTLQGKTYSAGSHATLEAASEAVRVLRARLHAEFGRNK